MDWNEFSTKRIIEVKQRIQTIVVYEYLNEMRTDMPKGAPIRVEAVVDQIDRRVYEEFL